MRPIKSEEGKWEELRKMGKIGEQWCKQYLADHGYAVMPLNYTHYLDEIGNIDWAKVKKLPKVPDGLARKGEEIFFYDAKTKRKYPGTGAKFLVNVRDYKLYVEALTILPVKLYFVFINTDSKIVMVFEHEVQAREDYPIEEAWDKNQVYNLSGYVTQVV